MSSSINTTKNSLNMNFLKQTAKYISGATGEYFDSAMPILSSNVKEAKDTLNEMKTSFKETSQSILPNIRALNIQPSIRNIYKWFTNKKNEYSSEEHTDGMEFDIDSDSDDMGGSEISEFTKGYNQVSSAVIESTHKMVESQVISTANIQSTLDKQTAIVSAGFKETNNLLSKLLEIVTKNTSTIIETNAALSGSSSSDNFEESDGRLVNTEFKLNNYKKIIKSNIENDPTLGMIMPYMPLLTDKDTLKKFLEPDSLIKMGIGFGLNKLAPNIGKNIEALDNVISDTIMSSLIRLGEGDKYGRKNIFSRLFGIDSSREEVSTERSSIELKATPFDTITKESITNAIPGYLRKILVALGGKDEIYDYRSRKFTTKKNIKKEFRSIAASTNTLGRASDAVREAFNNPDDFTNMTYDLMINDLGSKTGDHTARNTVSNFKDKEYVEKYILEDLYGGKLKDKDKEKAKVFASKLSQLPIGYGEQDIFIQAVKNNINRSSWLSDLVDEFNNYNIDASFIKDNKNADISSIKKYYDRNDLNSNNRSSTLSVDSNGIISASDNKKKKKLSGVSYTNTVLYEIFRRLNTGINVFKVGSKNIMSDPFEAFDDSALKLDEYKPKTATPAITTSAKTISDSNNSRSINNLTPTISSDNSKGNLLKNRELEDGSKEDLTKGERAGRWAKSKGGSLVHAMFNGNAKDVQNVFNSIVKDVTEISGSSLKEGLSTINTSFGNVSGYLKHKMFGTEYEYTDEKGKQQVVKANDKKGIFGWFTDNIKESFKDAKNKAGSWLKDIEGYFDYGDKDPESKGIASKRRSLIRTSVGAFAGLGLFGHPLGLIAGAMAGNALDLTRIGSKLKGLLFGHNKETGKPTGIISKVTDAITSPIKFQVGKTATFAASLIKKHVFGPMSDIGQAIKDRAMYHVESAFDKIKSKIGSGVKKAAGFVGKGVVKAGIGLATVGRKLGNTAAGKVTRGVLGAAGSAIGFVQNRIAGHYAKNTYHKLKKGEVYPLKVGQKYLDISDKSNHQVRILDESNPNVKPLEDIEGNPLGIWLYEGSKYLPYEKDYLKWRRKKRNADIDKELEDSGFYGSGRSALGKIKGFFGGDYKKWHEQDLKKRQNRRDKLKEYTAEVHLTQEQIDALKAEKEMASVTSEMAKDVQSMKEDSSEVKSGMEKVTGEIIPGHSFKTHDQGIHDRLDQVISLLGGSPGMKPSSPSSSSHKEGTSTISENDNDDGVIGSIIAASATVTSSDDTIDSSEDNYQKAIFNEASKSSPNKKTMLSKLQQLTGLKKKNKSESSEKKESLLSKIIKGIGSIPSILKIGAGIGGLLLLLKNVNLKKLLPAIGKGISTIAKIIKRIFKWFTKKDYNDEDPTTEGMNAVTSAADIQADSSWDYATPGASLYHNERDAAGNRIKNSAATEAKDELLWKMPLRQDYYQKRLSLKTRDKALEKSLKWSEKADAYAAKSGFRNKVKEKISRKISDVNLDQAEAADNLSNAPRRSTVSSIGRNVARIGVMNIASMGAGTIAGGIASKFGANEEVSNSASRIATATVAGGMTINAIHRTMIPTKKSWVDKIINGLSSMFKWLSKKFGAEKVLRKIGSSKIASTITKVGDKIINAIKNKISDKIIKKIEQRLASIGVKNAATVASAGLAIGVGAVAGLASGFCGVEHLFGILPGEADAGMKTIASVFGAVFGALEMTPAGMIIAVLDIIDEILIAIPTIGKGTKQMLAESLYKLFGGSSSLSDKQAAFSTEKEYYKNKFGIDMNDSTFSDAINNTGFFDKAINGSVKIGSDGHLKTDDAGGFIKEGGISSLFVGKEKAYLKDKDGNVIRDENGKPIQLVDAKGHGLKKDKKWGDYVGDFFGDVGKFITGKGSIRYKTDKDGNVIYDENGKPIKDEEGTSVTNSSIGKWSSRILGGPVGMVVGLAKDLSGVVNEWNKQDDLLDEDGKVIKDSKGKNVKKKSLKDFMLGALRSISSALIKPINDISETANSASNNSTVSNSFRNNVVTSTMNAFKSGAGIFAGVQGIFNGVKNFITGAGGPDEESENSNNVIDFTEKSSRIGSPSSSIKTRNVKQSNPLSKEAKVSSSYGPRAELGGKYHKGVDLIPADGSKNADVSSQYEGTVVSVKNDVKDSDTGHPYRGENSGGNSVKIQTSDGSIVSSYHLKAGSIPSNLTPGTRVHSGQKIGSMGSTGHSTGEHLHYQIERPDKNGNLIPFNPLGASRNVINNKYRAGDPSGIDIVKETYTKNTESNPGRAIYFIVVHYTAGVSSKPGSAVNTAKYFANQSSASADFIVDDGGIVQYNPDIKNRYTFHCGGSKYNNKGGKLYGKCTNANSIGIEMCSSSKDGKMHQPNDSNYYFTDAVVNNTKKLVRYLMKTYNISANNVVRHYDTTGKPCPGIKGWNADSGSESNWKSFKKSLGATGDSSISESGSNVNPEFAKWIKTIKEIKLQMANSKMGYSQGSYLDVSANGNSSHMRTDCSGFVSACVSCFSGKSVMTNTGGMINDNAVFREAGFTKMAWPGWDGLYQGDIVVNNSHTEIFSHNDGGSHYVWNCGSNDSCNNPNPTRSAKSSYTTVWRHRSSNGSSIDMSISELDALAQSNGNDSSISNSGSGFSGLIGALTNIGNKFLYEITGGLLGEYEGESNNSNNTDGNNYSDDNTDAVTSGSDTAMKGQTVNIPSGLGKNNSFMGWQIITSPTSTQYKLRQQAGQNFDSNGYGKINGRYTIATTTTYGNVGDYIDVYREDGSVLKAVIADIKNQNDAGCNKWGHQDGNCITEFVVDKDKWYAKSDGKSMDGAKIMNSTNPGMNSSAVTKIVNQGSYFEAVGGPDEEESEINYQNNFIGLEDDLQDASINNTASNNIKYRLSERIGSPDINRRINRIRSNSSISNITNFYKPSKSVKRNTKSTLSSRIPQNISLDEIEFRDDRILPNSGSDNVYENRYILDNKDVVNLLNQVLQELRNISSNTGSSSNLLGELNQKDFVDKGLRDSISAVAKAKSSSNYKMASGSTSIKNISQMARP